MERPIRLRQLLGVPTQAAAVAVDRIQTQPIMLEAMADQVLLLFVIWVLNEELVEQ